MMMIVMIVVMIAMMMAIVIVMIRNSISGSFKVILQDYVCS